MQDIKVKEHHRVPKIKAAATKLPKELLKTSALHLKETSHRVSGEGAAESQTESTTQYGSEKIENVTSWTARRSAGITGAAGRKAVQKSYQKLRQQRQESNIDPKQARKMHDGASEAMGREPSEFDLDRSEDASRAFGSGEKTGKTVDIKNISDKRDIKVRGAVHKHASIHDKHLGGGMPSNLEQGENSRGKDIRQRDNDPPSTKVHRLSTDQTHIKARDNDGLSTGTFDKKNGRSLSAIKTRSEIKRDIHTLPKRTIKAQSKEIKSSPPLLERYGKVFHGGFGDKELTGFKAAKRNVVKSTRASLYSTKVRARLTRKSTKTAGTAARGLKAAAQGAVAAVKALVTLLAPAGALVVFLIMIMGIIGGALFSGGSESTEPLSQEVISYEPTIRKYAVEYGIPEFVEVLQAIMMQESTGLGTDPMQASESPYNTLYPNSPGSIADPEYSIQVGVRTYADCVREASCEAPYDMDRLKLSLQGYNFGNGYITWALNHYGGYSAANALQFSQEQAAAHGWSGYGDTEYVAHVLRFYSGGNLFSGLFGNGQLVSVAKAQLGNVGGQKFWDWYGFDSREEWCACFVSWCADQCGLINDGSVPLFSYCPHGIAWFQSKGRWKARTYTPTAGTIIFFDWEGDGISDHVGIVERCENGIVYTIEGNSGDEVREKSYDMNSGVIVGYGVLY